MMIPVTDTVGWVNQCFAHGSTHEHVGLYLVHTPEGVIMVDSGSFYHRAEIQAAVDEATDGAGPAAIILSHSDYPHAANVSTLDGNDVDVIASSGAPAQQGLPDARHCDIGGELDVKGRRFSFIDPPLADRSHTTWIYDHTDGVLFTADGFGNYHDPDQCSWLADDFSSGTPADAIYAYHRDNLVWLRYVAPQKIDRSIEDIFASYDVRAIAPIHGNPIPASEIPTYRARLSGAIRRIADEYEVS